MTLEAVIAAATHLAGAVESGDQAQARRLAAEVALLASRAELQTIRQASQRVVDALTEQPDRRAELGIAMITLADEIALLINDTGDRG